MQHYYLSQLRLQRKLANSEAQVVELAHLIRQLRDKNHHLNHQLCDAQREIDFYQCCHHNTPNQQSLDISQLMLSCHQLAYEHLLSAYTVLDNQLAEAHATSSDLLASHASQIDLVQRDRAILEEQLAVATTNNKALQSSVAVLEHQLVDTKQSASAHAILLNKEKDAVQRLTTTVQKSRMAEDALRAEITELTTELTDAQRYQQAYYDLADEIGSLLARNQIAEEEATKLSRFNAEILGHNNPAQRIMYVDRIRRELAEAKHNIAMSTREQDALAAQNEDLQNELDMYKSVTVPITNKPRTNLTRIARVSLECEST